MNLSKLAYVFKELGFQPQSAIDGAEVLVAQRGEQPCFLTFQANDRSIGLHAEYHIEGLAEVGQALTLALILVQSSETKAAIAVKGRLQTEEEDTPFSPYWSAFYRH